MSACDDLLRGDMFLWIHCVSSANKRLHSSTNVWWSALLETMPQSPIFLFPCSQHRSLRSLILANDQRRFWNPSMGVCFCSITNTIANLQWFLSSHFLKNDTSYDSSSSLPSSNFYGYRSKKSFISLFFWIHRNDASFSKKFHL